MLRQKVNEERLNVEVDSAGTIGLHAGSAPDSRMITTAKNRGTDISFLKARQFTAADFEQFDVIFAMDKNNKRDILSLAKTAEDKQKVHLLLSGISDQEEANVPDPYYGTSKDFEHVYNLVDKATNTIIQKIKNNTLI